MAAVRQNHFSGMQSTIWNNNLGSWNLWFKLSYLLLQVVDLCLTLVAVNIGFLELNPVMRGMLSTPVQLALMKLVIPFILIWLVPGRLLVPGILLLSAVVGWNIKELLFLLF